MTKRTSTEKSLAKNKKAAMLIVVLMVLAVTVFMTLSGGHSVRAEETESDQTQQTDGDTSDSSQDSSSGNESTGEAQATTAAEEATTAAAEATTAAEEATTAVAEATTAAEEATTAAKKYGWVKEKGKWYFYNLKTGKLEKNKIVKDKKGVCYFVDSKGVRVDEKVTNLAVKFVRKNTKESWSASKKMSTCIKVLVKKHKFRNAGDVKKVKASQMPGYAKTFFTKKKGNCYSHAAAVCYIARVLGYENVRVGSGKVTGCYTRNKKLSVYHGWAEAQKGKKKEWYVYDLTFGRRYPKKKLINVTKKNYAYNLKPKKNFVLQMKDGKVSWK